ncbi:MAG: hypothetical protein E6R03_04455 [Hyphomicrobiaceae bacterium]|nr:MAG: hypothetical protein E6R03_04455 [Hyphomicrobiaceae bacterium]
MINLNTLAKFRTRILQVVRVLRGEPVDEAIPVRRMKRGIEVVPKVPPGCTIEQDEEEDSWVVFGIDGSDVAWGRRASIAAEAAWDVYNAFDHSVPATPAPVPPNDSGPVGPAAA